MVDVKLEAVNVDLIAQEERETGKPAQPPKKPRIKKSDIPFVAAADRDIWESKIHTGLISWSGTCANQFNINADPKFESTICSLWDQHIQTLPHVPLNWTGPKGNTILRSKHEAIASYVRVYFSGSSTANLLGAQARQQIRTYRSNFATAALEIVTQYLEANGDDKEERKQIVQELLYQDIFTYEVMGPTVRLVQFFSFTH